MVFFSGHICTFINFVFLCLKCYKCIFIFLCFIYYHNVKQRKIELKLLLNKKCFLLLC